MDAVPSPFPPDIWCALAGNCTLQSLASGADMSLQLFVWHGQWPQLHQGASASLLCLEEMQNKKPTKQPPDQPLPPPPQFPPSTAPSITFRCHPGSAGQRCGGAGSGPSGQRGRRSAGAGLAAGGGAEAVQSRWQIARSRPWAGEEAVGAVSPQLSSGSL